jgi:DNA polymerase-3 subunit alpha
MVAEFAHLHLHTEFSLLDGMGRIDDYVTKAKKLGVHHLAVTDHGVMYAAHDWYKATTKAGLHPIIGMEAYLAEGKASQRDRKSYHLLLLCENETGYRNLLKLASKAALEGYYYRPRIDLEMLQSHSEGLIVTSACLGGPVANNFLHNRPEIARIESSFHWRNHSDSRSSPPMMSTTSTKRMPRRRKCSFACKRTRRLRTRNG